MGNVKLQVGEDYLNYIGIIRTIKSYSIKDDLYIDCVNSLYKEDGTAIFNSMSRGFIENHINGLNLITHIPKANKEPSDEDINHAYYESEYKYDPCSRIWRDAIKWYKQQTK